MSFHTFLIKLYFKTSLLDGKISRRHISPWRIKSVKSLFQSMIVKLRSCSWPISKIIVSLKSLKSWGKNQKGCNKMKYVLEITFQNSHCIGYYAVVEKVCCILCYVLLRNTTRDCSLLLKVQREKLELHLILEQA